MSVSTSLRADGVAVITLCNPPVNALGKGIKSAFATEFPKLVDNPAVKAIVVTGDGRFFCGGFDIAEFEVIISDGEGSYKDVLGEMLNMMDGSPKTTVAAVNGQALGGGLEVALACHYRVAGAKTAVGFPEVTLGLLPGGQGTQRLPRLAPLPVAIDMIMTGAPMKAPQAHANGILDAVVEGDVIEAAAAMALSHNAAPISKRTVPTESKKAVANGALDKALKQALQRAPGSVALSSIIECIRAACTLDSFQDGLKVEMREFKKVLFGVQSKALRHVFFAERNAAKVPGVNAAPAPLRKIGIVGAGLMGGGIAMCLVQKGVPVVMKDAKQEWLDAGLQKVEALWAAQVEKGRITKDVLKGYMNLIKPTLEYKDFADVDAVIEAVPEIMDLKKEVFRDLDANCKQDALIFTNTSGLDIDEIAAVLRDPSRAMGAHFFSPANVMQLLENVHCAKSSQKTLATGMALGRLIGKKTVLVRNCDGFVGNRMMAPYAAEAKMLFEEGAEVLQIDGAATTLGMAMGPMALGDLVGQELFWKQRKAAGDMNKQTKTYYGPYDLTDWLCEQGRFGLKTPDPNIKANGRGIFIHRGRAKEVDPDVIAKQAEIRKLKGLTARSISDDEITERLFFPLINEGFKILEQGFASKASDIDMVYLAGYGFPTLKGGPMFYAENYVGLPRILQQLKMYDAKAKERYTANKHYLPIDYFEPSALLEECVAEMSKGTTAPPGSSLIGVVLAKYRAKKGLDGAPSKL